jgi:hypothetical protein
MGGLLSMLITGHRNTSKTPNTHLHFALDELIPKSLYGKTRKGVIIFNRT